MFKKADKADKKPKLTGPKACGVLVGQRSIVLYSGKLQDALSGVATGTEYPIEDGKLAPALKQLLDRGEIGKNVAIGLDPTLDFLSTARADDGNQIQAQGQLGDRLAGRLPGGVASRENKAGSVKIKLKSLLFFPRRIGMSVLEGLRELGRARAHLLSTTHVLYAAALKSRRTPRKWKVEIRVLVSEPESVALLVYRGVPVARQAVPTTGEGVASAIASVLQRLVTVASSELNLGELSGIIVHSRDDWMPLVQQGAQTLNAPVIQAPAIPCTRPAMAAMLCHAARRGRKSPLELGSVLDLEGERPSFPIKQFVPAAAALLGGAYYLWSAGSTVLAEAKEMEAKIEAIKLEREIQMEDIVDLRDAMGIEVGAAEAFLMKRVYWGEILGEISDIVPEAGWIEAIDGFYPFVYTPVLVGDDEEGDESENQDKQPAPRINGQSHNLTIAASFPMEGKQLPVENELFIDAVQYNSVFKSYFPVIEGAVVTKQTMNDAASANVKISIRAAGSVSNGCQRRPEEAERHACRMDFYRARLPGPGGRGFVRGGVLWRAWAIEQAPRRCARTQGITRRFGSLG